MLLQASLTRSSPPSSPTSQTCAANSHVTCGLRGTRLGSPGSRSSFQVQETFAEPTLPLTPRPQTLPIHRVTAGTEGTDHPSCLPARVPGEPAKSQHSQEELLSPAGALEILGC